MSTNGAAPFSNTQSTQKVGLMLSLYCTVYSGVYTMWGVYSVGCVRVGCVQCGACTVWGMYSVGCVRVGCVEWGASTVGCVCSVGCVQCGACTVWGVYSVGCV